MSAPDEQGTTGALDAHVRVVREGHGANCSSIGSVIDTLFATAAVGGALLAAVAAAVRDEGDARADTGPERGPREDERTDSGVERGPREDERAPDGSDEPNEPPSGGAP